MEIINGNLKSFTERRFPKEICFKPIGVIHSPFKTLKGIPIQPTMSKTSAMIEIFLEYQNGLKDLEGFSYIYCLYVFDMVKLPVPLQSKPFLQDDIKGVFSIRTPFRPNPIGLSILELLDIEGNIIKVNNIDMLDKTPVLDIKPYVPQFDFRETDKIGWLKNKIRDRTS
ncbi:MAG: tRNA (N6-threonylcarbamoyladenosine(37)-N6)-methyltransferase TrmO [Promethearchaeota archaeon]|jgi:tRNA-Thr(GGU) m(6)t(6)A37 methyltransferase TsaA